MKQPAPEEAASGRLYVAYVITLYWVVSISMVYLNKVLLSSSETSIPAPLFITWFQCVVTCIVCIVLGHLGETLGSPFTQFPKVRYEVDTCKAVLPLSIVFVGMVCFNNICLQLVQVSFYNVARSLSLLFNVMFMYVVLSKVISLASFAALIVVLIGFVAGIEGELEFSFMGTSAGVLASMFVALNSVYTSKVLPSVNNDKSLLLFCNNLNASIIFLPLVIMFEYEIIVTHIDKFASILFWTAMTISGVMGFAIGLVTVMQVKATSPLTHNISGTAKAAVQSLAAFYIWGNPATLSGVVGLVLVLVGSALYTWVQMKFPVLPSKLIDSSQTEEEEPLTTTAPDIEADSSSTK